MREEKKYLVQEVESYLERSEHLFLADYTGVTVTEVSGLRRELAKLDAEFHVVKNSILKNALSNRGLPALDDSVYVGPIAIITGGDDASGVANAVNKFQKDSKKCPFKAGLLGDKTMSADDLEALAKLPSKDVLRAQLLSLFNTPAQQCVRVMQAVPEGVLNVLQAKSKKGE